MSIHLNSIISRRRFIGGISVASLSSPWLSRSAEPGRERWALLADTHIAADPALVARGTHLAENLRKVIAEVLAEKEGLSGVLIDGDCAYNEGLKGDYETLARLLDPLVAAGLPIHMTLGNHDDRGPFHETFAARRPGNPPVENKHAALVESPLANWIFLDSLRFVNKVEGELGAAQLEWLGRVLDASPGKAAILVGHHYPQVFREDVIPSGTPIRISGLVDSGPFLEAVSRRKQAKAYIFGHSHDWKTSTDDSGFHQVNLPPTAYVFNPKRPSGWVRATLGAGGMRMELICLDKSHPEHGQVRDLNWR